MTKIKTLVNGTIFDVEIVERDRNSATFTVSDRTYKVELAEVANAPATTNGAPSSKTRQKNKPSARQTSPSSKSGEITVCAPIPGLLVGIDVAVGDSVAEGQILLRLEAMKMENSIIAPKDATVTSVEVDLGDEVKDGQILIRLT